MDLKSLRYGVQYGAQYGPRLTEKYCRGATFFLRRTRAPNVYTSARNIVHQNSKFFEPWNWHKELLYSSYFLFKFRSNCLMSTFCLFTFLSANIVTFFAIMTPFSAVMFMIECSVTQSGIRIKSDMSTTWKVSKYGVFSGPYFPAFGLNTERYVKRGRREKWEIVQMAFFLIIFVTNCRLTLSWRRSLSYRNQIIDFHSKTMDWFLYYRAVGTSVVKELNALDFIQFSSTRII